MHFKQTNSYQKYLLADCVLCIFFFFLSTISQYSTVYCRFDQFPQRIGTFMVLWYDNVYQYISSMFKRTAAVFKSSRDVMHISLYPIVLCAVFQVCS